MFVFVSHDVFVGWSTFFFLFCVLYIGRCVCLEQDAPVLSVLQLRNTVQYVSHKFNLVAMENCTPLIHILHLEF